MSTAPSCLVVIVAFWMDIKRDNNDATIALRQTRGLTHCCRQRLPQLPSEGLVQGRVEEDLDHLCHGNGGWQQQ